MRFVRGVPRGGRVLELGAGDGRFVARLAAAGYDAQGVEPSASARAAAAAIGARVEPGSAEDAAIDAGSLDCVVVWHALEHLDDPGGVVRAAHRWLREGGSLILAVPEIGSLQARLGGDLWFHQDVPRHRTHFSAAGLSALAERSGFRVRRLSHLLVEQNPLGMWLTLLNRLTSERDFAFRLLKRDLAGVPRTAWLRDLPITLVVGPLLVPIAIALELAAGAAGRGGTMVLVAEVTP